MDNEYSGSVSESASDDQSSIHDEDGHDPSTSERRALSGRGRSSSRRNTALSENSHRVKSREPSLNRDHQIIEDAKRWAATFEPPESAGDIQSPQRHQKLKRPAKPAQVARVKKLRSFYNYDYRQLLNIDIQEASSKMYQEDYYPLQQTQIGSSIWTAEEKHIFFTALAIIGRNNVHEISSRIGSKSEFEVQNYLQLLNQAMIDKISRKSHDTRVLETVEIPAAFEISEECSDLLERAGDSIAARQEFLEIKTEEEKWGDIWLITPTVSRLLDRRRRDDNGSQEMDEVLPAANLFVFNNWIELSERLYMNSGEPRQEDNWNSLAEPGEVPAIRATAFEDFHSLAVSITKRLVSTTLYCTMSRLRARESHKVKHAEVNATDVQAAVNILGLKPDMKDYWQGCARRCNLQVVNDNPEEKEELESQIEEKLVNMTYDEVEAALAFVPRQRSRSRSMSRASTSMPLEASSPMAAASSISSHLSLHEDFDNVSDSGSDLSEKSGIDFIPITREDRVQLARVQAKRVAEHAQEAHMQTVDRHASHIEEAKLWELLKQPMPFELDIKLEENLDAPKAVRDTTDGEDWRDYTEYWSQWETLETPVPEHAFALNRKKWSKTGKRRKALATAGKLRGPDAFADVESVALGSGFEAGAHMNELRNSNGIEDAELENRTELEENNLLEDSDEFDDIGSLGYSSPSNHSILSENVMHTCP